MPMNSFLKKRLPLIMAIAAVISLVGAVLILAVPVARADAAYKKVLGIIISVLMIILSLLLVLYIRLSRDTEPNFFLFDRTKKRNIAPEDLTFKPVNERLNFFLTCISQSQEELWTEAVLENDSKMGYRAVYRPLLAYKMLYDLADKNNDTYWDCLMNASAGTVDALCEALTQGGETRVVEVFRYLMDNMRNDPTKIQSFISGNQKYIRGRIMAYIKINIELFY